MNQRVVFRQSLNFILALALLSGAQFAAYAGTGDKHATKGHVTTGISIENFGQVNDHLYRGAQPENEQYQELAALGIRTVLDLRADAKKDARANAERAGLRYINLPLRNKSYPQADAATRFLEIVNDPANGAVYVHCAGGRHRTGSMIAVYRMDMDHWTVAQAYDEMKQYDFYTSNGHGCYKDYVYDHSRQLQVANNHQLGSAVSAH
jgi:protein tyrosine phosphatase (PTP) superfamily phosphohydrolase (DUF442 family)